jgi:ribosomal-protein-alanine N-acetyltransferase
VSAALHTLQTPRLQLLPPDAAQTAAVVDFYRRNAAHFAPWDPPLPPDHSTPEVVERALVDGAEAFAAGRAHRWWLTLADGAADGPARVIGSVHLSGLVRGAFQSCNLGYALDADCQGRGLMHEALAAVIDEAFSPRLNLHRIQAGVRPENSRSLAVLARQGFQSIGLARGYLFIAGDWRDHQLFERCNPAFIRPAHW